MTLRNIGPIPSKENHAASLRAALMESFSLENEAHALPGRLRESIRPLLPECAFLRRARGEGLFVTDAPRHTEEDLRPLLTALHFVCEEKNGCLTLLPDASVLTDFERLYSDPPDFFCRTLLRFRGEPPSVEALRLFAVGVRLLEASTENERRLYVRRVRSLAAVSLRTGQGGAYACALIAHVLCL